MGKGRRRVEEREKKNKRDKEEGIRRKDKREKRRSYE